MTTMEKLTILAESAKYDAACTSSGVTRASDSSNPHAIGHALPAGCCHSFSADGRCITLLKVLMSNVCAYDCKYCINRKSNDVPRATFTPSELADLTIQFYRRNYIEGLFLSSGVIKNPDYTSERMLKVLELLRHEHHFGGYIHAKVIPGTSPELLAQLGYVADRVSVNIEFPSEASLDKLAPDKSRTDIFKPMAQITKAIVNSQGERLETRGQKYTAKRLGESNHSLLLLPDNTAPQHKLVAGTPPIFAPGGQATQMIIGASPETDYHIIRLASSMYRKYQLKRVFYSAYVPTVADALLPALDSKPQLLREHRLYQADWLMRKYQFSVDEILSEREPNFNPYLDPKCNWAIHNFDQFPVDVNTADHALLLRVPGIGPTSALRIVKARRYSRLGLPELKRMGVVLKRAQYFILTHDRPTGLSADRYTTARALVDPNSFSFGVEQLTLFDTPHTQSLLDFKPVSATQLHEELVRCLATTL